MWKRDGTFTSFGCAVLMWLYSMGDGILIFAYDPADIPDTAYTQPENLRPVRVALAFHDTHGLDPDKCAELTEDQEDNVRDKRAEERKL